MKKLLIFSAIAVCLACSNAKAQTVNGVRLSELKADYIEVCSTRPIFSKKVWIRLEYGQKVVNEDSTYIKDENGVELEFNSIIDCVNKMKSYGYELFDVYVIPLENGGGQKNYILKKKS